MLADALVYYLQRLGKRALLVCARNGTRRMMQDNVYMVAYELKGSEREDAALERILQAYGGKKQKLLRGTWLVKTSETEKVLSAKLAPALGPEDRCVIVRISRCHWWAHLPRILRKVTLWMAV